MTCLLFCEHLDTLLSERSFSLDLYVFVTLKNLSSYSCFFLVQVVFKSFFSYFAQKYFKKIPLSGFSRY